MEASTLSPEDFREIAGRASTLDERIAGLVFVEPPAGADEEARARTLYRAWRKAAAADDDASFARRLRAYGIDEHAALGLFGRARLPAERALPEWAETFRLVCAQSSRLVCAQSSDIPSCASGSLPFEELLAPIAAAAQPMLVARTRAPLLGLLTRSALADLEKSLLARLSAVCTAGLFGDFALFRHLWRNRPGRLPFSTPGSRAIYRAYVEAWRTGRHRTFFLAHPVAARLIGTVTLQWIEACGELVARLERDLPALRDTLLVGGEPGAVESISAGLSDAHRGGRTVAILTFAQGTRIVYKPKDLRVDAAWAELLAWLERQGAPPTAKSAAVLVRDGYGWAEFVDNDGFRSEAPTDPAHFYRRAGGLLALLHLLCATDCHHENVRSSGGFPTVIDLETLLHPRLAEMRDEDEIGAAYTRAASLLQDSVAATAYLPTWKLLIGGHVAAIGGLDEQPEGTGRGTRFRDINTDAMDIGFQAERVPVEGMFRRTRIADHAPDFMAGFDALYAFLEDHRAALLEQDGPLAAFRAVEIRAVLQGTAAYAIVQHRSRSYANLADGAAWSLHFDYLIRGDLGSELSTTVDALRAAERAAAARCDIPMFTARSDATWLEDGAGERIDECLSAAPFERLLARVRQLGADDVTIQRRLVRGTIGAAPVDRGMSGAFAAAPYPVTVAIGLGLLLDKVAIRCGDEVAWIGLRPIDHEHHAVSVTGIDLYSGSSGIALFLAALAHVTGEAHFRGLAMAAAAPARAFLRSDSCKLASRQLGIGGTSGLGSIVYVFTRMAALLDDAPLLDDAHAAARLIEADLIDADRSFDVVAGAAGAILGLLALHRASGDAAVLDAAAACGRHLVQNLGVDRQGNPGWQTGSAPARFQTGFSHGAAGIGLALLRLDRAIDEPKLRAAAEHAFAYERKLFMPLSRNWPDMRTAAPPDGSVASCQWCYGATGIGLARLACLKLADDAQILEEVEHALSTTLAAPPHVVDDLCCGGFGRSEFLLTAGLRLGRPQLVASAHQLAATLIRRAEVRGEFAWSKGDDAMNPGFFKGISGIGYQLLRLSFSHKLPSVLLWN